MKSEPLTFSKPTQFSPATYHDLMTPTPARRVPVSEIFLALRRPNPPVKYETIIRSKLKEATTLATANAALETALRECVKQLQEINYGHQAIQSANDLLNRQPDGLT